MERVVGEAGLATHIQFNRKLVCAKWDPSTFKYTLEVEDTKTGSRSKTSCHVLISAVGIFRLPDTNGIPGLDNFAGKVLHTSQWDPQTDLRNKKVAIIGNGASG